MEFVFLEMYILQLQHLTIHNVMVKTKIQTDYDIMSVVNPIYIWTSDPRRTVTPVQRNEQSVARGCFCLLSVTTVRLYIVYSVSVNVLSIIILGHMIPIFSIILFLSYQ